MRSKVSMPGSVQSKLGVYVSHNEYSDPIDFGEDLILVKKEKKEILIFLVIFAFKHISQACHNRRSLYLVCMSRLSPMMGI